MTPPSIKLAAAGLSSILALSALTACSSENNDTAQSTTATSTDSSRIPGHTDDAENTTQSHSKKNENDAPSQPAKAKTQGTPGNDSDSGSNNSNDVNAAPDNAGHNNAAPHINVNPDPHVKPAQPLTTGTEHSPDSPIGRDIHTLVAGVYAVNTLHDMLTYVPNNTCKATLDRTGGRLSDKDLAQIPDMPLNALNADLNNTTVKSISNLRVDDNRASADVTVTTPNGEETNTQRFLNEDGRWKFCGEN